MAKYPTWTRSDGQVFPVRKFSSIIKVWAAESAKQLKDAYNTQKLWNNTRANAVWTGTSGRYVRPFRMMHKGKMSLMKGQQFSSWSWYEESKLREIKDRDVQGSSKGKYWFSTGHSFDVSNVSVVNATMESGEIDFHTTAGALFAEAGVGLNGPKMVRGKRGSKGRKRIKVDRSASWTHKNRYVGNWEPSKGKTHRPNTKQQVYYLRKRLEWAAKTIYQRDLTLYLGYTMEEAWKAIGKIPVFTGNADGSFTFEASSN